MQPTMWLWSRIMTYFVLRNRQNSIPLQFLDALWMKTLRLLQLLEAGVLNKTLIDELATSIQLRMQALWSSYEGIPLQSLAIKLTCLQTVQIASTYLDYVATVATTDKKLMHSQQSRRPKGINTIQTSSSEQFTTSTLTPRTKSQ